MDRSFEKPHTFGKYSVELSSTFSDLRLKILSCISDHFVISKHNAILLHSAYCSSKELHIILSQRQFYEEFLSVETNNLSTLDFKALGTMANWMLGNNRNWTFINVEIVSFSWSELAGGLILNLFIAVCVNDAMYSARWNRGFRRNMQPTFSGQKLRLTFHQTTLYHDTYVCNNNITVLKISAFFSYMSHIIQIRANWKT